MGYYNNISGLGLGMVSSLVKSIVNNIADLWFGKKVQAAYSSEESQKADQVFKGSAKPDAPGATAAQKSSRYGEDSSFSVAKQMGKDHRSDIQNLITMGRQKAEEKQPALVKNDEPSAPVEKHVKFDESEKTSIKSSTASRKIEAAKNQLRLKSAIKKQLGAKLNRVGTYTVTVDEKPYSVLVCKNPKTGKIERSVHEYGKNLR